MSQPRIVRPLERTEQYESDSERRQKEFVERTNTFMTALDVDETVAQLLASEGFRSVEEIAYVDVDDLASIEGFDLETAGEIQSRAQGHLAGIELQPYGPVMVRGMDGPPSPYIPSGGYG